MKNKAFTLIELLVVVAIIGILAAVGTFAFSQFTNYTKIVVTKNNHNEFLKFLKLQLSVCELHGKIKIMSDANSLLVSTKSGLKRLKTPFKVIVCKDIESYKIGDELIVNYVGFNTKDNLLYFINQQCFKYSCFIITDKRLID